MKLPDFGGRGDHGFWNAGAGGRAEDGHELGHAGWADETLLCRRAVRCLLSDALKGRRAEGTSG